MLMLLETLKPELISSGLGGLWGCRHPSHSGKIISAEIPRLFKGIVSHESPKIIYFVEGTALEFSTDYRVSFETCFDSNNRN